jgi:hypothetical protein
MRDRLIREHGDADNQVFWGGRHAAAGRPVLRHRVDPEDGRVAGRGGGRHP